MNRLDYLWGKWRAIGWLVIGREAQALALFDEMAVHWPADVYVMASRVQLLASAGRTADALEVSTRLVAVQADNAGHWFNRGYLFEQAERWDEALEAFRRATELSPKLDRAWYGMGLVLIRLQRYDDAVVALKRNTELQPMSPYGWYQLARVHVDRQAPDEAIKIIKHLQGFEPKVAAQLARETGLVPVRPTL
jgi:tetratricopeptide (TPR) repeat protein